MTLDEARAYDERKETGPHRRQVAVKREILWRLIGKYLPDDRSVPILDLGGGTGLWTIPLAQEDYEVVLADISPGFLARAKEKLDRLGLSHRVTIAEMDVDDLSRFDDGTFNLVLALGDPLSYCTDAERALAEIRRITKRNGILIGDVEGRYGGVDSRRAQTWEDVRRIMQDGIAYWPGSDGESPIRLFTPTEMQEMAESSGWSVVDMYASDLVSSLLDQDILDQLIAADADLGDWIALEESLRAVRHLLGCGREIQFVLRNPGTLDP